MPKKKLSASEALYGFAAWLTSLERPVTFSTQHEAGVGAELLRAFCEANGLAEPREDWTASLVTPEDPRGPVTDSPVEAVSPAQPPAQSFPDFKKSLRSRSE